MLVQSVRKGEEEIYIAEEVESEVQTRQSRNSLDQLAVAPSPLLFFSSLHLPSLRSYLLGVLTAAVTSGPVRYGVYICNQNGC
jgi:hypothetical protein